MPPRSITPSAGRRPRACGSSSRAIGDGVSIGTGCFNNAVEGNFIGTVVTGFNALGNTQGDGVWITGQGTGNTVSGNLISCNHLNGVELLGASGDAVQNNTIGTDINGTQARGNGRDGVLVTGGSGNLIAGNEIAGNGGNGVEIVGNGSDGPAYPEPGARKLDRQRTRAGSFRWGTASMASCSDPTPRPRRTRTATRSAGRRPGSTACPSLARRPRASATSSPTTGGAASPSRGPGCSATRSGAMRSSPTSTLGISLQSPPSWAPTLLQAISSPSATTVYGVLQTFAPRSPCTPDFLFRSTRPVPPTSRKGRVGTWARPSSRPTSPATRSSSRSCRPP